MSVSALSRKCRGSVADLSRICRGSVLLSRICRAFSGTILVLSRSRICRAVADLSRLGWLSMKTGVAGYGSIRVVSVPYPRIALWTTLKASHDRARCVASRNCYTE
eukprot:4652258-Amphidinium_carterae.1